MELFLWNLPVEILTIIFSFLSFRQCLGVSSLNGLFRRLAQEQAVTVLQGQPDPQFKESILQFKNLASLTFSARKDAYDGYRNDLKSEYFSKLPKSLTRLNLESFGFWYILHPSLSTSTSNSISSSQDSDHFPIFNPNNIAIVPNTNPWIEWEHYLPQLVHLRLVPNRRHVRLTFENYFGDKTLGEWFMLSLPRKLQSLAAWIPFQRRYLELLPSACLQEIQFIYPLPRREQIFSYRSNPSNSNNGPMYLKGDEWLEFIPGTATSLSFPYDAKTEFSSRFFHCFSRQLTTLNFYMKHPLETWKLLLLLKALENLGVTVAADSELNVENFEFITLTSSVASVPFPPNLKRLEMQFLRLPHFAILSSLNPWFHLLPRSMVEFHLHHDSSINRTLGPMNISKLPATLLQQLSLPATFTEDNPIESLPKYLKRLTLYRSHQQLHHNGLETIFTQFPHLTYFKCTGNIDESAVPIVFTPQSPIQTMELRVVNLDGQFFKIIETFLASRIKIDISVLSRREMDIYFKLFLKNMSSIYGKSVTCSGVKVKELTFAPNGISRIATTLGTNINLPNLPSSLTFLSSVNYPIKSTHLSRYLPNLKTIKKTHLIIEYETMLALSESSYPFNPDTIDDYKISKSLFPNITRFSCTMSYENPERILEIFPECRKIKTSHHPLAPCIFNPMPDPFIPPRNLDTIFTFHAFSMGCVHTILSRVATLTTLKIRVDWFGVLTVLSILPPQLIHFEVVRVESKIKRETNVVDLDSYIESDGTFPSGLKSLIMRIPTKLSTPYYSFLPKQLEILFITQWLAELPTEEEFAQLPPTLKEIKFGRRPNPTLRQYLKNRRSKIEDSGMTM